MEGGGGRWAKGESPLRIVEPHWLGSASPEDAAADLRLCGNEAFSHVVSVTGVYQSH